MTKWLIKHGISIWIKTSRVLGNTRKVASSLAKGKSLDSFIDKEAFNKLANKNYDANLVEQEQAFKHFIKLKIQMPHLKK